MENIRIVGELVRQYTFAMGIEISSVVEYTCLYSLNQCYGGGNARYIHIHVHVATLCK